MWFLTAFGHVIGQTVNISINTGTHTHTHTHAHRAWVQEATTHVFSQLYSVFVVIEQFIEKYCMSIY